MRMQRLYICPYQLYLFLMYAPRHENCPLCVFEIVEKSDTFCDGEHKQLIRVLGI
jgi:hypothetical protein